MVAIGNRTILSLGAFEEQLLMFARVSKTPGCTKEWKFHGDELEAFNGMSANQAHRKIGKRKLTQEQWKPEKLRRLFNIDEKDEMPYWGEQSKDCNIALIADIFPEHQDLADTLLNIRKNMDEDGLLVFQMDTQRTFEQLTILKQIGFEYKTCMFFLHHKKEDNVDYAMYGVAKKPYTKVKSLKNKHISQIQPCDCMGNKREKIIELLTLWAKEGVKIVSY